MLAVVYEAMADAGPRRKGRKVPGPHRVNNAVYPGVNLTCENVDELLFFFFSMRPRTPLSRHQPYQVHADLLQSRNSADAPLMTGVFVAVGIFVAGLRTRRRSDDEWRFSGGLRHPAHVTQLDPECISSPLACKGEDQGEGPIAVRIFRARFKILLLSRNYPVYFACPGTFLRCGWRRTTIRFGRQAATCPRRGLSPPWLLDSHKPFPAR
jgi:hypothetical protein